MTVSGVIVAFRKKALVSVGLWDRDMITEDVAVSWKLERKFWDIRYEPKALCWMLVPETIKGLWRQRKRWAQGGQEVLIRHRGIFLDWRQRRLWPIYIEQVLSIVWSICWAIYIIVTYITADDIQDILISLVFWLYMLLVFLLFIGACINNDTEIFNTLKAFLSTNNLEIREVLAVTVRYFLIIFVILFSWKFYNKRRFGNLHRRRMPTDTTDEEMLALGLMDEAVYNDLKKQKVIVFKKSPIKELERKDHKQWQTKDGSSSISG